MSVDKEKATIRAVYWACAVGGTIFIVVIIALWCGWGLSSRALASGNPPARPKTTGRGFTYQNDRIESVPWSIHIGKLDRSNKDFELHTVLAKGNVVGLNTLSEQMKDFPQELLGRPIAAINGDFFRIEKGPYQGDPKGLQIMQGELLSAPCDWSCFWLDADGNPHMTNVLSTFNVTLPGGVNIPVGLNEERTNNSVLYTPRLGPSTLTEGGREFVLERDGDKPWLPLQIGETYTARVREVHETGNTSLAGETIVLSISPQAVGRLPVVKAGQTITISTTTLPDLKGCRTAIGGGPPLVRAGKAMQWQSTQFRHPRTAIGWNSNFLYIVEVDGRQRGLSVGMTYPELADYMVKLGCEEALNLDGGGSATFWLYGQVVSSPSEGHERTTANGLVIVRKPKAPPVHNPD